MAHYIYIGNDQEDYRITLSNLSDQYQVHQFGILDERDKLHQKIERPPSTGRIVPVTKSDCNKYSTA